MRTIAVILTAALGGLFPTVTADPPKPEKFDDTGFEKIFDGKSLAGWKVSAKTGHSRTSKNQSGGKWEVKDGAIVGSQDVPGNGGMFSLERPTGLRFLTRSRLYEDAEWAALQAQGWPGDQA